RAGETLWSTVSPLGEGRASVDAEEDGYIIGATTLPLVQPGQAIVHVALPGDRIVAEDDPTDDEDEDPDDDVDD
ncbi:MAG: succinylglutamate desuccinylase, partial [Actinomycetota bacterium]